MSSRHISVTINISGKYKLKSVVPTSRLLRLKGAKQRLYVIFFQELVTGGNHRQLTPWLYPFAKLLSPFHTDDTVELAIQELYGQLAGAYNILNHGEPGFEKTKTRPPGIQR